MVRDTFVEELRDGQAQEKGLAKHWGGYNAREVEQYVEKLLNRMGNMEKMYQERYEEMRTGLLGITRERDEQAERISQLEQQVMGIPDDWEQRLAEQGMIALPREAYEALQAENQHNAMQVDALGQQQVKLSDALQLSKAADSQAEVLAVELEQAQVQLESKASAIKQSSAELQALRQQQLQLQADHQAVRLLNEEQVDALKQAKMQYQALEVQQQLAKDMVQQLMDDKQVLEQQAVALKQQAEAQKASLVRRYQVVLRNQQQCLRQLQDSFAASVGVMENIGQAGLQGFPGDGDGSTDNI